jgi:hypothetical protein
LLARKIGFISVSHLVLKKPCYPDYTQNRDLFCNSEIVSPIRASPIGGVNDDNIVSQKSTFQHRSFPSGRIAYRRRHGRNHMGLHSRRGCAWCVSGPCPHNSFPRSYRNYEGSWINPAAGNRSAPSCPRPSRLSAR